MKRRGEQPERVPAVPPGVADPVAGVEDHEVAVMLCQEVAHGEAGLPAADHDGVEVVLERLVCHGCSSLGGSVESPLLTTATPIGT
jgi:hypothetical protein